MVLTAFCYYFLGLPHFMKGVFKQKAHFWPLVIWTHLTAEPFMSLLFKCHKQPKDQCQLLASLQRTNKPVCAGTYFNSQWFCWRPNLVFIIVSKQLVECLKLLNNYQVIKFNLCKLWSEASAVISFWCKLAILAMRTHYTKMTILVNIIPDKISMVWCHDNLIAENHTRCITRNASLAKPLVSSGCHDKGCTCRCSLNFHYIFCFRISIFSFVAQRRIPYGRNELISTGEERFWNKSSRF